MQKKDSPKGDELEILGMLANNYENENFPVGFPDPVEAMLIICQLKMMYFLVVLTFGLQILSPRKCLFEGLGFQ